MTTHYRSEGVILEEKNFREADRIFTIYTKEFGKLTLLGRSVRKGKAKLKMNTSLFSYVDVQFIQGKGLNTLTDIKVLNCFAETKKDLSKLSLFYRIGEMISSLIYEEERDERVFSLLLESFEKINNEFFSKKEKKLFFCFVTFQMLYFLGYKLYIKRCPLCSKEARKDGYFVPQEGGVVCKDCYEENFLRGVYIENVGDLSCFLNSDIENIFNLEPHSFIKVLKDYLHFIPKKEHFRKIKIDL